MDKNYFDKLWAPISTFAGAVLLLLALAQAFKGDGNLVAWLILFVSMLAIAAGMWKYAFSLSDIEKSRSNNKPVYFHRYSWHGFAKFIFWLAVIFVITSLIFVLTIIAAIPDCCGLIPTETPTQTSTFTPTIAPTLTLTSTLQPSPTLTETPTITFTPTFSSLPTKTRTKTPRPTSTSTFTPTPDPIIYRGLDRNCIDSTYWNWHVYPGEPTPESYSNRCWNLGTRGISAPDKKLRVNVANTKYPLFSLSTNLPEGDLEIHFKVEIETFSSKMSSKTAVLVFGIGSSEDEWQQNGNYIMYSIPPYSDNNQVYEDVGENKVKRYSDILPLAIFLPKRTFDIVILIKGNELTVIPDKTIYSHYPVGLNEPGGRDRFWIGYQLPTNSILKATISEFYILQK